MTALCTRKEAAEMKEKESYIERYSRGYGCTEEEAKNHATVKEVLRYYDDQETRMAAVIKSSAGAGMGECK